MLSFPTSIAHSAGYKKPYPISTSNLIQANNQVLFGTKLPTIGLVAGVSAGALAWACGVPLTYTTPTETVQITARTSYGGGEYDLTAKMPWDDSRGGSRIVKFHLEPADGVPPILTSLPGVQEAAALGADAIIKDPSSSAEVKAVVRIEPADTESAPLPFAYEQTTSLGGKEFKILAYPAKDALIPV